MTRRTAKRIAIVGAAGLVIVAVIVAVALVVVDHRENPEGNLDIPATKSSDARDSWFPRQSSAPADADGRGPRYVTSVSANGRYFLDQSGRPILLRGDSPWSLMTDLSRPQVETYFSNRETNGFNAVIVSLVGAVGNGGPHDDGATYDGIKPFVGSDILRWNQSYWKRARAYVQIAAEHGITVLLYPIDAWVVGHSFKPRDIEQCRSYGRRVASYLADLPNIVWMAGGDYVPDASPESKGSDVDHCTNELMRGVRSTGDNRLFSIQLGYGTPTLSTDNDYWRPRVDWNFVYTYNPTYAAVLRARAHRPPIPAVLGEANYERENNQADTPGTTNETLRRQVLWALTSGAAGDIYGSDDWEFVPGWQSRLEAPGMKQVSRLRQLAVTWPWWRLNPDSNHRFLRTGRGEPIEGGKSTDVLDSVHATAALTPSGGLAVVYVPTTRTFTIDASRLASGVRATWIDPSDGTRRAVPVKTTYTTPGANADGDHDWLLVFSRSPR